MNLTSKIALVFALSAPAFSQTAAEQLQKGIFAQESQGKADDAISIYRQLANSTLTPREIAAQAQYRLSQTLLQKGDIANATREMERLERDFSEYRTLISSWASQSGVRAVALPTAQYKIPKDQYNMNSKVIVTGKVKQVAWVNPTAWFTVNANGQDYRVQLATPNSLFQSGWTKDTVKIDDQVTVEGATALDGSLTLLANLVTVADGRTMFDRNQIEEAMTRRALEVERAKGK